MCLVRSAHPLRATHPTRPRAFASDLLVATPPQPPLALRLVVVLMVRAEPPGIRDCHETSSNSPRFSSSIYAFPAASQLAKRQKSKCSPRPLTSSTELRLL